MNFMTDELLIHPKVDKLIGIVASSLNHAVIINGPAGSGKTTLVKYLASRMNIPESNIYTVESTKSTIGIEAIRRLRENLKYRPVQNSVTLVHLKNSESMTIEAQNAFLKLLEEPPANIVMVLTTKNYTDLLPTIKSRAITINVLKPPIEQLIKRLNQITANKDLIDKALIISEGWPKIAITLVSDSDNELIHNINRAKEIFSYDLTAKLKYIDTLVKEKDQLPLLLFASERIVSSTIKSLISKNKSPKEWINKLAAIEKAQTALSYNCSPKIVLTHLMMKL